MRLTYSVFDTRRPSNYLEREREIKKWDLMNQLAIGVNLDRDYCLRVYGIDINEFKR